METFDSRDGAGNKLEEAWIDVLYDNGSATEISGTLSPDRILRAAFGPWHVTGPLTVPAGITLQIEPGSTLFFHPGAGLMVNGRLLAEGTLHQQITSHEGARLHQLGRAAIPEHAAGEPARLCEHGVLRFGFLRDPRGPCEGLPGPPPLGQSRQAVPGLR